MQRLNSRAKVEDGRHRELLEATARGSRQAFRQLYDLMYSPLARFIYGYVSDTSLIEEILNDTMLVVWQKSASFRGESRVMTWVLGIASKRSLKALRRERVWHHVGDDPSYTRAQPGGSRRLDTLEALDWALKQLNTEQRLAIELAYFHGMTCDEIGVVLQCSVNTAKTRLHYGRRKLRNAFTGEDPALEFSDLIDEVSP